MKKHTDFILLLSACLLLGCGCTAQTGEDSQPAESTERESGILEEDTDKNTEGMPETSEHTESMPESESRKESEDEKERESVQEESTDATERESAQENSTDATERESAQENSTDAKGQASAQEESEDTEGDTLQLDPNEEVAVTLKDLEKLPQDIYEVIYEDGVFYDIEEQKEFTKEGYRLTMLDGELSSGVIWEEFNVADVDQDGEYEFMVYLTVPEGPFEIENEMRIFDLSEGTVYAHPSWFRAIKDIYENGVVGGSSGADWYDHYLFSFDKEEVNTIEIMHTEMEKEITEEHVKKGDFRAFFIGEEKVTIDEYEAYRREYMNGARRQYWCRDALE